MSLPTEVHTHVLRQLASQDIKAVCALQRCSTAWRAVVDAESFWRSMCAEFYPQPTATLLAADKLQSYRVFFVQQAASKLPSVRPSKELKFKDLHWTAEICVAPYSGNPGGVHPPKVALTRSFSSLPADGKIMFSDDLGGVRLCTTEQFLEKKDSHEHSDYKLVFFVKWTVRSVDGKGTVIYDDIPDENDFVYREGIVTGQVDECSSFSESYDSRRWYRDETLHDFAHVLPEGSLTLSCSDGWIVAREVGLRFMLDNYADSIEYCADEKCTLDVLKDFEWA